MTSPRSSTLDAIIIGSGPNGLAAAITLARAGRSVRVYEGSPTVGGGLRTAELTQPGFRHDICATVLALAAASPFFKELPLETYGLQWIVPDAPLAHPLDDGTAVVLERSVQETAKGLGPDAGAYRQLMEPFLDQWDKLAADLLGPARLPTHPLLAARFGSHGIRSAAGSFLGMFHGARARALLAGLAAHAVLPLEQPPTAAFALILGLLGHQTGWPFAQGGSQRLADALTAHLQALGGEVRTGQTIRSFENLPKHQTLLADIGPRAFLQLAGDSLPPRYVRQLSEYRYGPGVFKVDWALSGPIPWKAAACSRAGTVHLGGTWDEIAAAERAVWAGEHPERPFVLLTQPSLFDATRAPSGSHTAWAYCHVPNGSTIRMTARIENQVERFAPGFKQRILARSLLTTRRLEAYNPNYVGGDINGGVQDWRQLLRRPTSVLRPYDTPLRHVYLCSASTPPGGGVHGLCGYYAAEAVLSTRGTRHSPHAQNAPSAQASQQ